MLAALRCQDTKTSGATAGILHSVKIERLTIPVFPKNLTEG
jgi:hypothetical protein